MNYYLYDAGLFIITCVHLITMEFSEDEGFDREGVCVAAGGAASEKSCCGNYQNNFRLIFNPNQQQCCDDSLPTEDLVKPIGECENPTN